MEQMINPTPTTITLTDEQKLNVQTAQSQLLIAKQFPRDEDMVISSIIKACRRYFFAEVAVYTFPKSNETVIGPSIRMAEMLAQSWGNMEYGWNVIEEKEGKSFCMAFCWDMQSNLRRAVKFAVSHTIRFERRIKKLTDPREIYEHCSGDASKRMRACIIGLIPADVIEMAMNECKKTLANGDGTRTLQERIEDIIKKFSEIGISKELIEKKLGHEMSITTGQEIADLIPVYRVIVDGQKKKEDYFSIPQKEKPKSKLSTAIAEAEKPKRKRKKKNAEQ